MKKDDKDLIMAENYHQNRDYPEAIYYFTKVIKKSPSDPMYYWRRGLCKKELGDYEGCMIDFDHGLKVDPDCFFIHHHKAELNYMLKNYQEAIRNYSDAIRSSPEYSFIYIARGEIKEMTGDLKGALIDYQLSRNYGCQDEAELLYSGRVLLKLREFHAAINKFDQLLIRIKDLPKGYYYRGLALSYLNRNKEAIIDFSKVLDFMPDSGYVYFLRGKSWMGLKQFSNAIADFDKATELNPANKDSLINKAVAMMYLDETELGMSILQSVLSDDPLNTTAINYMGLARILTGDHLSGLKDIWASGDILKKQRPKKTYGSLSGKRRKTDPRDDYLYIVEI